MGIVCNRGKVDMIERSIVEDAAPTRMGREEVVSKSCGTKPTLDSCPIRYPPIKCRWIIYCAWYFHEGMVLSKGVFVPAVDNVQLRALKNTLVLLL